MAAGIFPVGAKLASATHSALAKPKQRKSAKKQPVLSSLNSASSAAVAGLSHQHSPLLNQYGMAGGQPKTEAHKYSAVFPLPQGDQLNAKTSNYYTAINQTLASQVASSMYDMGLLAGELLADKPFQPPRNGPSPASLHETPSASHGLG